jgi:DNA ligase-associated metallophosphoesterase
MNAAPLHMGSERLMLDPGGVLAWPGGKLLAVADLHLEKGSAFAARGRFLPPYDTRDTLDRLALLVRRWNPAHLLFLGDSFHDPQGAARLPAAEAASLHALLKDRRVTWVTGNHDPLPTGLPGDSVESLKLGPFTFRHVGTPGSTAEISGHYHPKATVAVRGATVTRACFLTDGRRLLLPAFGSYTGGLEIADPAIAALFPRGGRAFLLGEERLYSFPTGPLRRVAAAPRAPTSEP